MRFYFDHIETTLAKALRVNNDECLQFDVESAMHRTQMVDRFEAWSKAIQGGVLSPNEARKREQLPPMEGGDDLFLQKQMFPMSFIKESVVADLLSKEKEQQEPELTTEEPPAAPEPEPEMELEEVERILRKHLATWN